MRVLMILITCLLVTAAIIAVVIYEPVSTAPTVVVPRIDMAYSPNPVLQQEPDSNKVLDFFPDLAALKQQHNSTVDIQPATKETGDKKKPVSIEALNTESDDRSRLLSLIDDWVYENFSQVGKLKQGRINQTRENKIVTVYEGEVLESNIKVVKLNSEAATLQLGNAVYNLPLAVQPDFFKEIHDSVNPRPLTPDEQRKALDYYMKRYGHKFKALSEGYQPPPGMVMPQQITPEMQEKSRKEYMEKYGQKFNQESNQFKSTFPYPQQQKENFQKYWEKYHPGQPMPNFDAADANKNQYGPANRLQPEPPQTNQPKK